MEAAPEHDPRRSHVGQGIPDIGLSHLGGGPGGAGASCLLGASREKSADANKVLRFNQKTSVYSAVNRDSCASNMEGGDMGEDGQVLLSTS